MSIGSFINKLAFKNEFEETTLFFDTFLTNTISKRGNELDSFREVHPNHLFGVVNRPAFCKLVRGMIQACGRIIGILDILEAQSCQQIAGSVISRMMPCMKFPRIEGGKGVAEDSMRSFSGKAFFPVLFPQMKSNFEDVRLSLAGSQAAAPDEF